MSETLDIQQPRPFDLVGETILVAGSAVAFEGTLSVTVSEGHDEYTGFVTVGATGVRQFQGQIAIPADTAFRLNQLMLRLADDTARADGPFVTVPVLYGPRILPGYRGWQPRAVRAGDTLSAIAREVYGRPDFVPIFEANRHILTDPDRIEVGQVLRIPRADL